jgi:hypothetical protein
LSGTAISIPRGSRLTFLKPERAEETFCTRRCREVRPVGGDRLTPEEISALVAQRALADGSHHCLTACGRDLLKRLQIADDKPFLLP